MSLQRSTSQDLTQYRSLSSIILSMPIESLHKRFRMILREKNPPAQKAFYITVCYKFLSDNTLKTHCAGLSSNELLIVQETLRHDGVLPDDDYFRIKYPQSLGGNFDWKVTIETSALGLILFPVHHSELGSLIVIPDEFKSVLHKFINPVRETRLERVKEFPPYSFSTGFDNQLDFIALLDCARKGGIHFQPREYNAVTKSTIRELQRVLETKEPLIYKELSLGDLPSSKFTIRVQGLIDLALMAHLIRIEDKTAVVTDIGERFKEAPREEQYRILRQGWLEAEYPDELYRLDGVTFKNIVQQRITPRSKRATLLFNELAKIQSRDWISIESFERKFLENHREFLRPKDWLTTEAISIDSECELDWEKRTGRSRYFLLEGNYLRAILFGSLANMGVINIAYNSLPGTISKGTIKAAAYVSHYQSAAAFQITDIGFYLLEKESVFPTEEQGDKWCLYSEGEHILILHKMFENPMDYTFLTQIATRVKSEGTRFQITFETLCNARDNNIEPADILEFLHKYTKPPVSNSIQQLLDNWYMHHEFASVNRYYLIETVDEEAMKQLKAHPELDRIIRVHGSRRALFRADQFDKVKALLLQQKVYIGDPE